MERKLEVQKGARSREEDYVVSNDFKEDEIDLVMRLHKLLGNKWSLIAGRLPGRTAIDVENYWNSHLIERPEFQLPKLKKIKVARPQEHSFKENGLLVPNQPPRQHEQLDGGVLTLRGKDTKDSAVQIENMSDQQAISQGL